MNQPTLCGAGVGRCEAVDLSAAVVSGVEAGVASEGYSGGVSGGGDVNAIVTEAMGGLAG